MNALLRIYAILSKEFTQLRRDKMTFGMVVMIPLIQLILFGYAINTNIRHIPVGVVDYSETGLSRVLIETISATQVVKFSEHYIDVQQAEAGLIQCSIHDRSYDDFAAFVDELNTLRSYCSMHYEKVTKKVIINLIQSL